MEDLKYPVGKFNYDAATVVPRTDRISEIERTPQLLRSALAGLSESQLQTAYRPGGWTVTQVVHHLPESHMNAYIRFKLALTENEPTIKPYQESLWAEREDTRMAPIAVSTALLDALHQRWAILLKTLQPDEWARSFRHPELGLVSLDKSLALYAWHGRHHVAHITALRDRMGWS